MKFTLVKLAQNGSVVARTLVSGAALITLTATTSSSKLDYVWDLLNMSSDDKTKKALEDELEIEDIFDFQLITKDELDSLPAYTSKKGRRKVCHLLSFKYFWLN